jgi:rhodanese-related sulfurtransferase
MESPTTKTMQDVEVPTLKMWLERGEALLIDVREPSEYAAILILAFPWIRDC